METRPHAHLLAPKASSHQLWLRSSPVSTVAPSPRAPRHHVALSQEPPGTAHPHMQVVAPEQDGGRGASELGGDSRERVPPKITFDKRGFSPIILINGFHRLLTDNQQQNNAMNDTYNDTCSPSHVTKICAKLTGVTETAIRGRDRTTATACGRAAFAWFMSRKRGWTHAAIDRYLKQSHRSAAFQVGRGDAAIEAPRSDRALHLVIGALVASFDEQEVQCID